MLLRLRSNTGILNDLIRIEAAVQASIPRNSSRLFRFKIARTAGQQDNDVSSGAAISARIPLGKVAFSVLQAASSTGKSGYPNMFPPAIWM